MPPRPAACPASPAWRGRTVVRPRRQRYCARPRAARRSCIAPNSRWAPRLKVGTRAHAKANRQVTAPESAPPMGVDFLTKWSAMRRGFSTCRDTKETRTPGRNKQRDVVCRTSRCAPPMRSELQLHRQTKQSDWLASVSDGTPAQSPPFNRDMPIGRCIAASNVYFAEVVSAPGARRAPTGSTAVRPRVAAG
jgi:hypothetical protein